MEPDKNIRTILVVQTAFLGDAVLATPLAAALLRMFPKASIHFMATPAGAALLKGLPGVGRVIAYDKRGEQKGLSGLKSMALVLKEADYDVAVSAHRSARTAVLLKKAGIKKRIGFKTSDLPWLYTHTVPRDSSEHETVRNMKLLEPLGGPPEDFDPLPFLAEPGTTDLVSQNGGGMKIGLCPGSVWPTKKWVHEGFAGLADMLAERLKASVYLIGGKEDVDDAARVEELSKSRLTNLAGKTGLTEWLSVMNSMDLVVTNDSSPTHVAMALGKPAVTVFGATTSKQGFAPIPGKGVVVEASELKCRPCGEHGAKRCPEGHFRCMRSIDPSRVFEAVSALLEDD